jgi:hypothetical protein
MKLKRRVNQAIDGDFQGSRQPLSILTGEREIGQKT